MRGGRSTVTGRVADAGDERGREIDAALVSSRRMVQFDNVVYNEFQLSCHSSM
jgi:hypothetical protein